MAAHSRREFLPRRRRFVGSLVELRPSAGLLVGVRSIHSVRCWKDFPAFVKMMAAIGVTIKLCSPDRLDTGEFKARERKRSEEDSG
jgi:hypothetical protein